MRIPIGDEALARLVIDLLREWVEDEVGFTAYDVTRQLRKDRPHFDIPHLLVRGCVHRFMQPVVSRGLYEHSMKRFGMSSALFYQPRCEGSWQTTIPLLRLDS
ncbi:MAG TPA: hypothetical protein VJ183_13725 [Chloroflexia bacterium]|nr:hypothetical protein [Chloroflexia bacterium]